MYVYRVAFGSKSEENLSKNLMNYGHTEITESTERDNGHTDLTDALFRLLMDDSHRDDCLILVENKGFMLLEES